MWVLRLASLALPSRQEVGRPLAEACVCRGELSSGKSTVLRAPRRSIGNYVTFLEGLGAILGGWKAILKAWEATLGRSFGHLGPDGGELPDLGDHLQAKKARKKQKGQPEPGTFSKNMVFHWFLDGVRLLALHRKVHSKALQGPSRGAWEPSVRAAK